MRPRQRTGRLAIGFGQGRQQVQGQRIADGLCDAGDGGGIVKVTPGGGIREKEMLTDEVDEYGDVGGCKPMRVAMRSTTSMPTVV